MKLHLLYTPDTPADRDLEYLQKRLGERRIQPNVIDAESRAGIDLAELYDVTSRPAAIATTDDGTLIEKWEGRLPSLEEVSYYMTAP